MDSNGRKLLHTINAHKRNTKVWWYSSQNGYSVCRSAVTNSERFLNNIFSDDMKKAENYHIFKKHYYLAISIFIVFSELLEPIIVAQLLEYFDNMLCMCWKKYGTVHVLIKLILMYKYFGWSQLWGNNSYGPVQSIWLYPTWSTSGKKD